MNRYKRACQLLVILLLAGWIGGCAPEAPREGVTLTVDAVSPLSSELLLEPQEGYGLYCLVVTVENLGDYETPFSGPDDISFLPKNSVSVLYGGFERFGYKTQDNIEPHGTAQIAVPFITADPDIITSIVYDTKQPDREERIDIPIAMRELLMRDSGEGEQNGNGLEWPIAAPPAPPN